MIRMVTDMRAISERAEKIVAVIEECVVEAFTEWAKEDDNYLRTNRGFNDRTGNLRSSLGAGVVKNGTVVFKTPFEVVLHGSEGARKGSQAIDSLASYYQGVIAKVMVAGMEYAQRVEDLESKDVLESRRIQCERDARKVVEQAMRNAEKKIRML